MTIIQIQIEVTIYEFQNYQIQILYQILGIYSAKIYFNSRKYSIQYYENKD